MGKLKFITCFFFLLCIFFYNADAQPQTVVKIDSTQLKLLLKTEVGNFLPTSIIENYEGLLVNTTSIFEKKKITYIYLWASWCEECVEHIPTIVERNNHYPLSNVQVIFISIDADKKRWRNTAKKLNNTINSYILPYQDSILMPLTLQKVVFSGQKTIATAIPVLTKINNKSEIIVRDLLPNLKTDSISKFLFHFVEPIVSPQNTHYNKYLDSCLTSIYMRDQEVRNYLDYIKKLPTSTDQTIRAAENKMNTVDSTNLYDVTTIITLNKGWIHRDSVSTAASSGLFLTIHHYPNLAVKQKYLPLIQQSVKEGWGNKQNLALLEDRIRIELHKKQLYGTQYMVKENGKKILYPIKNKRKLNIRRKKMDLLPMEEYCRMQNILY